MIWALLLQFWPYIAGAIGLGIGALKWRSSIIKGERAKQQASEMKARDVADEVDADLGTLTPAQRRERLGEWSAD